jgi:hypothetical protein
MKWTGSHNQQQLPAIQGVTKLLHHEMEAIPKEMKDKVSPKGNNRDTTKQDTPGWRPGECSLQVRSSNTATKQPLLDPLASELHDLQQLYCLCHHLSFVRQCLEPGR